MIMYLSNYIVANPLQSYGYAYGLRLVLKPVCIGWSVTRPNRFNIKHVWLF